MSSTPTFQHAGLLKRFLAGLIDLTVLNIASTAVALLVLGIIYVFQYGIHPEAQSPQFWDAYMSIWEQAFEGLIYLMFSYPYYVISQTRTGQSLGKKLFGLWVVDAKTLKWMSPKKSQLRYLGYLLSYLPVGCGYLMAVFHPERKCLHDLLAGTIVVSRVKS